MKCTICKNGETKKGLATVTLTREQLAVVFQKVPAQICDNCGEEYVDELVTETLLKQAENDYQQGVHIDVREYMA